MSEKFFKKYNINTPETKIRPDPEDEKEPGSGSGSNSKLIGMNVKIEYGGEDEVDDDELPELSDEEDDLSYLR